jgi:ATP adenylyltransferase
MGYEKHSFRALFDGRSNSEPWDTVILRVGSYAVAPTRGSILPRWLLVVPEAAAMNFAAVREMNGDVPTAVVSAVVERLGYSNRNWLWFEHGAAEAGTAVGCGIDHAHLHLLLDPGFDLSTFEVVTRELSPQTWKPCSAIEAYDDLKADRSYYAFGNATDAFVCSDVNLGSQFFRRVVAGVVGRPNDWDYKADAGIDNIASTLRQIGTRLFEAA